MEKDNLNEIRELPDNKEEVRKEANAKPKRAKKNQAKEDPVAETGYYTGQVRIKVMRMADDVILPVYSKKGDACMDVRAYKVYSILNDKGMEMPIPEGSFKLYAGWSAKIGTGLRFQMPPGWSLDPKSRSGLAIKHQLIVANTPGKLDCNYTGELIIGLLKVSGAPIEIKLGERIAQIEPVKQTEMVFEEVDSIEDNEDRGSGGIGHTGVE